MPVLALWPILIRAEEPAPERIPAPTFHPPVVVRLWNGRDLAGWVSFFRPGTPPPAEFWRAADGILHLGRTPPGYLRTEKSFADYHLHVEWRWPVPVRPGTNNSGIFVLQQPPDAVWPESVQVQVKTGACGDLIAQGGLTFPLQPATPLLKKMAPASEKPAGEWNLTDIYCRGASIEVVVNGQRQNFVDRLAVRSGQIALQMEGSPIDFRNIWLESL